MSESISTKDKAFYNKPWYLSYRSMMFWAWRRWKRERPVRKEVDE